MYILEDKLMNLHRINCENQDNYFLIRRCSAALLVCCMVISLLIVGSAIDAKPKQKDIDDIAESGLWDDLKKLMPDKMIEGLLKRIGLKEKEIKELEKERDIHMAHAVSCANSVTQWENQKKIYDDNYTAAYDSHSDASQAIQDAEKAIRAADQVIKAANENLDRLYNLSMKYGYATVKDQIESWQTQKSNARTSKSNAEADIPMQQAIIEAAETYMTNTHKHIVRAQAMIKHFQEREEYHRTQVLILNVKISVAQAEKAAEEKRKDDILKQFK